MKDDSGGMDGDEEELTQEAIQEFKLSQPIKLSSFQRDFVDHFRRQLDGFDYEWEERWIRQEGYLKLVAPAVQVGRPYQDRPGRARHFFPPALP